MYNDGFSKHEVITSINGSIHNFYQAIFWDYQVFFPEGPSANGSHVHVRVTHPEFQILRLRPFTMHLY